MAKKRRPRKKRHKPDRAPAVGPTRAAVEPRRIGRWSWILAAVVVAGLVAGRVWQRGQHLAHEARTVTRAAREKQHRSAAASARSGTMPRDAASETHGQSTGLDNVKESVPAQARSLAFPDNGTPRTAAPLTSVSPTPASKTAASRTAGSFLESFGAAPGAAASASQPTNPNEQTVKDNGTLEMNFQEILKGMQQRDQLKSRMAAALAAGDSAVLTPLRLQADALAGRLNKQLSEFEADLKAARTARPDDPLVQWLTGELLMYVGGEPAEMQPYFERAVAGGLQRPRLWSSLARVQFEGNHFAEGYQLAVQALDAEPQHAYFWETYNRIALGNERFDELVARLEQAFPATKNRPGWATRMLDRARRLAVLWHAELQQREADLRRDDLPRARLLIEHRHFVRDSRGNISSKVETAEGGSVELELFEDQAPETVANFISLVDAGFYDGTLFEVAEAAGYVRGGDPNSKNADTSDDGLGGPGYTIPDEFDRPDARGHFRGSISMVNTGPGTAGSQFFIRLTPDEHFNGHFTVFGRVIHGQESIESITPGRTTTRIGHYGKVIPGDRLVRAEVTRRRAHEYVPAKLPGRGGSLRETPESRLYENGD